MIRRAQVLSPVGFIIGLLLSTRAFTADSIMYDRVLSMGFMGSSGSNPQTRLLAGTDGTLYGTTYQGGIGGQGTIFTSREDGSGFRLLHEFSGFGGEGARPYSDLVFGPDGAIYGTTEQGGTNGAGTIFKIRPDGSGYQVLFHFFFSGGSAPRGQLLQGPDGAFYGTTQVGGPVNAGTVYTIRPDGTGFRMLHSLSPGTDADTGLTLGSDGWLYGVTSSGGSSNSGTIFKLDRDGGGFAILHHFEGRAALDGEEPDGRLLELSDGALYGTTERGGLGFPGFGTVYRIRKDGTGYEVLRRLNPTNGDPTSITSELIPGSDGALYSTTSGGGGSAFKIQPDGSGVQILHAFLRGPGDGSFGRGVVFGADGALYGATQLGGLSDQGILYRINPDGTEYQVLHHFQQQAFQPMLPRARLRRVDSGTLYGTTEAGGSTNAGTIFSLLVNGNNARILFSFGEGANAAKSPNGLCDDGSVFLYGTTAQGGSLGGGTIFRIDQNGSNYSVLRHLGATGEPRAPRAGLLLDSGGWFYGTSSSGGASNRGAIFKLSKNTAEFVVLRSLSVADGYQPQCELTQDSNSTLYGTASLGGQDNLGVVFSIRTDGSNYTVLHSFSGGALGQNPTSGVIIGSDGRLYGTTSRQFGSFAGCVYALSADGSGFEALRSFTNADFELKLPRPTLVEGSDGWLYGATQLGGAFNKGTLFRIAKDGSAFAILHEFGGGADGQTPSAAFTPVGDGSFLGVTEAGGDTGNGLIFRFDPAEVRLRIGLSATSAYLSWPISSTADAVEISRGTSGFNWLSSPTEISQQGQESHITVPREAAGEFFRIRRIWR